MSTIIVGMSALAYQRDLASTQEASVRLLPAWQQFDDTWWQLTGSTVITGTRHGTTMRRYVASKGRQRHVSVDLDALEVMSRDDARERVTHDVWSLWAYAEKRFVAHARMHASILHARAVGAYHANLRSDPPGAFDPSRLDDVLSRRWLGDDDSPGALLRLRDVLEHFDALERIEPHKFVSGWISREAQDTVWSLAHISHRMRPYVSELRSQNNDVRSAYDALVSRGEAQRAVLAALSPHVEAFCEPFPLSALEEVSHDDHSS